MAEKLGQHFLNNPLTAGKITRLLSPQKGENILEIGAGRGFLTEYLSESGARITAVEIDSELASGMRERFKGENLKVMEEDFLKTDMEFIKPDKICGNLPYQISGKIIQKILLSPCLFTRAVLMLPLAVARRVAAEAGESEYSRLSVLCRAAGEVGIMFEVEKENFTPPPKIASAVVKLEKKVVPGEDFLDVVKGAFRQRRKKIKNSLANYFHLSPARVSSILQSCGINPDLRAQDITSVSFRALTGEFVKRKIL